MHRKSLEAAEQLKDDTTCSQTSDKEDDEGKKSSGADSGADPDELRNNSIACLRAKAQEHSAKILRQAEPPDTNGNTQQSLYWPPPLVQSDEQSSQISSVD